MGDYRLTSDAESDLTEIADYTIENFRIEQARRYRNALEACFRTIADNPKLERKADQLASKLRRHRHKSHVVFYRYRITFSVKVKQDNIKRPAFREEFAKAVPGWRGLI